MTSMPMSMSMPDFNLPNNVNNHAGFAINPDAQSAGTEVNTNNFQTMQGHFDIMALLDAYQNALLNGNQQELDDIHQELKIKMPGTDVDDTSFERKMTSIIHVFKFQCTMNVQVQQESVVQNGQESQVTKQSFNAQINISIEAYKMKEIVELASNKAMAQPIIDQLDSFITTPEDISENEETSNTTEDIVTATSVTPDIPLVADNITEISNPIAEA